MASISYINLDSSDHYPITTPLYEAEIPPIDNSLNHPLYMQKKVFSLLKKGNDLKTLLHLKIIEENCENWKLIHRKLYGRELHRLTVRFLLAPLWRKNENNESPLVYALKSKQYKIAAQIVNLLSPFPELLVESKSPFHIDHCTSSQLLPSTSAFDVVLMKNSKNIAISMLDSLKADPISLAESLTSLQYAENVLSTINAIFDRLCLIKEVPHLLHSALLSSLSTLMPVLNENAFCCLIERANRFLQNNDRWLLLTQAVIVYQGHVNTIISIFYTAYNCKHDLEIDHFYFFIKNGFPNIAEQFLATHKNEHIVLELCDAFEYYNRDDSGHITLCIWEVIFQKKSMGLANTLLKHIFATCPILLTLRDNTGDSVVQLARKYRCATFARECQRRLREIES